jgi:hypothetical protein
MKISIVIPFMGQHELVRLAVEWAISNLSCKHDVEIILIDNVSETRFPYWVTKAGGKMRVPIPPPFDLFSDQSVFIPADAPNSYATVEVVRLSKPIGVYPIFWEALKHAQGEVICFFHSDLIVCERAWDDRIANAFNMNSNIGLIGFIGSNEIDSNGGRGGGTTSNFQGAEYEARNEHGVENKWKGSPAQAHGKRSGNLSLGAVIDGCSMIFRRSVLEQIKQRPGFPPHHFYDRLLSCEVRELGYDVGVFGIECDHISGQTVGSQAYVDFAKMWCLKNLIVSRLPHPGDVNVEPNWDMLLYQEAERQWLSEYRNKGFVPSRV